MMLRKMTVAACVIASIGIGGSTGSFVVRRAQAQETPAPAPATKPTTRPPAPTIAPKPAEIPPLLQELVDAARERFKAQEAYYEEGRIAINRFIEASTQLQKVELLAAKTDAERKAIRRRHIDRLKEIERRERAEMHEGRSTVADLTEARQARLEAEFDMGASEEEDAEKAALLRRVADLERKIEQLQKERRGSGRD